MAVPYMQSGLTLPESNTPYAIYYVPISQDDKSGARGVIENLGREHGLGSEFAKLTEDSGNVDHRREYLRALNQHAESNYSLDVNPLESIEMTQRIHSGPQPGYGASTFRPAFARGPTNQSSVFHKYATRQPVVASAVQEQPSARKNEVRATVVLDTGIETVVHVESDIVVAEILRKVVDQLSTLSESQKNRYLTEYGLFYGDKHLDFIKRLREYGITGRDVRLTLKPKSIQGLGLGSVVSPSIASINVVPKLSKAGYQTEPSYLNICKMTEKELSQVEDFSIKNQWGKIHFLGKTDLRGLNLDKIVIIEKAKVEIYPENSERPEVGKGLNKSATITFYHYGIRSKQNLEQWLARFKAKAAQIGAEYIGHDVAEDSITIQVEGTSN